MRATELLRNLGQSLWLDNITRDLLNDGSLKRYIDDLSITGLTSNPTIFDHAIKNSAAYDAAILDGRRNGKDGEALFFDLALEDIRRAADLFRPVYDRTDGVDGWVSLEVPPSLAHDTLETLAAAKDLSARADRLNVFIKIPGTPEGLPAIEEAIFAGVPINVTLLFSVEQYIAAAEAYIRGIERRIESGPESDGRVCSFTIHQPLGRCRGKQSPRRPQRPTWDCGCRQSVQKLSGFPGIASLAARLQLWSSRSAIALGEHRNERPPATGYVLREISGGPVHCEYHA